MRYLVERNFINVLGKIWLPPVEGAYTYDLSSYDVENIGEFTRENIADWLSKNAGDFQQIIDFYATVGDKEIPWSSEDNEIRYNDLVDPPDWDG